MRENLHNEQLTDAQASTYISFFTSPNASNASIDPQSIQHLLQGISSHIIYLLRLIPPGSDTNLGTTSSLLQLGKRVISAWTKWLDTVSAEVNQRNGMFPHSMVEGWAYNLDHLVDQSSTPSQSGAFGWSPQPTVEMSNVLVNSFRDAMRPLRQRFTTELGWLIGRRSGSTAAFSTQDLAWGSGGHTEQNEDEEL